VIGVQNRPRVSRARRDPWYNLKTELVRRRAWPILLPRRIFVKYRVWANDDMLPASENFIEARPKAGLDTRLLLAVLASSFAEMSLRVNAHQYGGGVYDLSPGKMASIRVPDVRGLKEGSHARVCRALERIGDEDDRHRLDAVVGDAFGFPSDLIEAVRDACEGLRSGARRVGGRT
jgi:hypothetical protein